LFYSHFCNIAMSSLSDSNLSEKSSLTPTLAQQLDELCDAFERAWKQGEADLAEYLEQGPAECRDQLLTELAAIELDYRRDAYGGRLTLEALGNLYPALSDELERVAREELAGGGVLTPDETPTIVQSTRRDFPESKEQTSAAESYALHIRCPHCREAVEVLDNTELEDVTCRSCGSAFSLVSSDDDGEVATTLPVIGRFELLDRVGIGGFGAVWKARDTDLGREVALKIPRKGNLRAQEIDFFFREARAAAQLRHPNIVPVFEIGREGDVVFIVSEFIHGKTLSKWSTTPPQHPKIIAELAAMIADALEHAHSHGIIHRDLKPSNVMIDELNHPRLMDLGLAKRETGEVTMTRDGQIRGTAA
ncbi:MAG: protein kinase, partial [Lacipirellulaceae bacterium]